MTPDRPTPSPQGAVECARSGGHRTLARVLLLFAGVAAAWVVGVLLGSSDASAQVTPPTPPALVGQLAGVVTHLAAPAHVILPATPAPLVATNAVAPLLNGVVTPAVTNVVAPLVNGAVTPLVTNVVAPVVNAVVTPLVTNVVEPLVDGVVRPVLTNVVEPLVDGVVTPVLTAVLAPVVTVLDPVLGALAPARSGEPGLNQSDATLSAAGSAALFTALAAPTTAAASPVLGLRSALLAGRRPASSGLSALTGLAPAALVLPLGLPGPSSPPAAPAAPMTPSAGGAGAPSGQLDRALVAFGGLGSSRWPGAAGGADQILTRLVCDDPSFSPD